MLKVLGKIDKEIIETEKSQKYHAEEFRKERSYSKLQQDEVALERHCIMEAESQHKIRFLKEIKQDIIEQLANITSKTFRKIP